MVEIDKDVPIPPRSRGGSKPKWPWKDLGVDDSFLMGGHKPSATGATTAGKKYGMKFISRTVEGGVRVWRIE